MAIAAPLVLLSACRDDTPESRDRAPSIVLLNVESLRADHLGAYGYERDTSPSIDALARESVRFEWAFGTAPMTPPAQASLLTGLYPSSHGVTAENGALPETALTLAELLSAAGYATAAFVDGGFLASELGFARGFADYDNSRGAGLEAIVPKATAWLEEHGDERFFLMLHTYDVHAPYAPPQAVRGLFTGSLEPPSRGFEPTAETLEAARLAAAAGEPGPLPPNDLEYAKALYDAEIRNADAWVGRLMEELRRLGLDSSTVIALVADHGEAFQEHGTLLHDTLHATVTRVPLLIRLPDGAVTGTIPRIVGSLDLMPTLLELTGVGVPPQVQGRSLVGLIEGGGTPPYVAFSESTLRGGGQAVALGGWRLIADRESGVSTLYNLADDPLELDDLAAVEGDRVRSLERHLQSWRERIAHSGLQRTEAEQLDAETLEQLRSLGYIQ